MVLAHPLRFACRPAFSIFSCLRHPPNPFSLSFVIAVLCVLLIMPSSDAQVVVNGQVFTNGLTIVDSPQPLSVFNVGSGIPIAVDVSGNGQLPQSASFPALAGATRFVDLQIYLVSSDTTVNWTVSGSGLLAQEVGSTVKHVTFAVPGCAFTGQYNLTFYESSIIDNQTFFTITPVPIFITQTGTPVQCAIQENPIQRQPQPSSPAPKSPWLQGTNGQQMPLPRPLPNPTVSTITQRPSGSLPSPFAPSLRTSALGSPTTVTVVLVSTETETVTTTVSGRDKVYTTTYGTSYTSVVVVNPAATGDLSGFVPVNEGFNLQICVYSYFLLLFLSTYLLL